MTTGPSSWAPASSGLCWRCSRSRSGGRSRPTTSVAGLWGDERPAERAEDGAALCLAPAAVARRKRGPDRNPARRLRVAALGRDAVDVVALRAASRRALARARRSPSGVARRWPTSPASRLPLRRFDASTSCACRPRSARSTRTWRRAGTPTCISELEALVAQGAVARAPPRAADARAVPLRPPIRGARGVPRRALRGSWNRWAWSPARELHRLQDAILAHDPALDVAAAPAAEPPTAAPAAAAETADCCCWSPRPLLVLAGVTAYGVIRVLAPDGLDGIGENAVGVIDPESGLITERYGVGGSPSAVVEGGGSVWVANAADGTVTRVDREPDRSAATRTTITVGGKPAALAFGSGSLWVADSDSRSVVQVDPTTNRGCGHRWKSATPRARSPVTAGAVWVASGVDARIQRIDLDSGRRAKPILIGVNPSAIAAGAGALWVASEEAGTVMRIEPRTGSVVARIPVGTGPSALAVGEGAVWVVNRHDGTLCADRPGDERAVVGRPCRPRPDRGRHRRGVGVGRRRGGGDRSTRRSDGPRVGRATPGREQPCRDRGRRRFGVGRRGAPRWPHTAAGRSAWGIPYGAGMGDPDRLAALAGLHDVGDLAGRARWPMTACFGYRRVDGAAGATLVGALADSVPAPSGRRPQATSSRCGRGSATPTGGASRPTDFRASMERFLQATRDYPQSAVPPSMRGSSARAGARPATLPATSHAESRPTCHRARSPSTSPAPTGTSCTGSRCPFAFVVPADSPRRATSGRTPPGTGPYRVTAWDRKRGGTLIRNRYFSASPARSRGPGFADRIDVRTYAESTTEAADRRGPARSRPMSPSWPTRSTSTCRRSGCERCWPVPRARFTATRRRSPIGCSSTCGSARSTIASVRRAINFAIDREKVVELEGGPEVAQPTCQIVPPGFPGHQPYCPYTAPSTGGVGWTAPDMEQARAAGGGIRAGRCARGRQGADL